MRLIRRAGLPRWVASVILPVAMLIAMLAWAFASPVGSSPDDDYHMASIWCAWGDRAGICETGPSATSKYVPHEIRDASDCYKFRPAQSANCPGYSSSDLQLTKRGNFDASYPPIFYATLAVFVGPHVGVSILLMRGFNVLLFVGLLTGLLLLVGPSRRPALLWGALVPLVPLGMFIVPSVNPSSWAVTSAAVLWCSMVAFFDAETRRRRIVLGGFAAFALLIGAGARSDAAAFGVIAIVVACVLSARRTRRFALSLILPAALTITGAAFFLTSGQSNAISSDAPSGGGPGLGLLTEIDLTKLPELWAGTLGTWGLGWVDTAVPAIVWFSTIFVFAAVTFISLRKMPGRTRLAAAIVFLTLIVVPMYVLVHGHVIVGVDVQPRYIYPLMILFLGVALTGIITLDLGLSRLQLGAIAVLLTLANSAALHTNIRRYVTGVDQYGLNLNAGREWWWPIPIGPLAMWVIGTVAFALVMFGIARAADLAGKALPQAAAPVG